MPKKATQQPEDFAAAQLYLSAQELVRERGLPRIGRADDGDS